MSKKGKGYNPKSLDNLKNFEPGQSGNPKGRAKGSKNVKTIIKELFNATANLDVIEKSEMRFLVEQLNKGFEGNITNQHLLVVMQFIRGLTGDTSAFNAILDRVEGKPKQVTENFNTGNYEDFLKKLSGGEIGGDLE